MTAARVANPRRSFGRTWWGRAWVDAMESRARLDPNRLPRGRTYARRGRVGPLTIEPGAVRALVRGSRATPYRVHVRVRVLSDREWDRLIDAVAARAGHTAALLDGELAPEVVADAAGAGVELLPGPGEVGPRCSCPDWADPCKHSAAVVYLVADVLDDDPFALLLLRGRSREEVLAALRRRRAGSSPRALPGAAGGGGTGGDAGVLARDAFHAAGGERPPLPRVPLAPKGPGRPAPLAVDPPASSGVRAADLAELAADAARRAWELCIGEGDGGLALDPSLDLIRRAAGLPAHGGTTLAELARRAGMGPRELGKLAAAWRAGGADALSVLGETWSPDPEALDEALSACAHHGGARGRANRVTLVSGAVQLRLSRGGSWYRFERAGSTWALAAGPSADPAALVP